MMIGAFSCKPCNGSSGCAVFCSGGIAGCSTITWDSTSSPCWRCGSRSAAASALRPCLFRCSRSGLGGGGRCPCACGGTQSSGRTTTHQRCSGAWGFRHSGVSAGWDPAGSGNSAAGALPSPGRESSGAGGNPSSRPCSPGLHDQCHGP